VRVAVTGATGTIGRALVAELLERGDEVTVLSRDPEAARFRLGNDVEAFAWPDPKAEEPPAAAVADSEAVVHLLGESVSQRWTREAKQEIRDSRVLATRNLVSALGKVGTRMNVLVSQSASGRYGARGDERLDESAPPGDDFLALVVRDWESEARRAEQHGLRVVTTRTGVVLSESGGALAKMLPFFKLGIGGPVAGGRQYLPWVHLGDVVGALLFSLDNDDVKGPVNVTAPEPVTNKEFSKALGYVLHRPAVMPVPGLALKALYGEMAMIVTTGQRVVPARLEQLGYEFRWPDLEPALRDATAKG
jgi:uncharacterized protein